MFLAQNLKFLREQMGIRQDEIAKKLDITQSAVGNWESYSAIETEKVKPNADDLEKLADFFGVTLDQLVKRDLSKEMNTYGKGSEG